MASAITRWRHATCEANRSSKNVGYCWCSPLFRHRRRHRPFFLFFFPAYAPYFRRRFSAHTYSCITVVCRLIMIGAARSLTYYIIYIHTAVFTFGNEHSSLLLYRVLWRHFYTSVILSSDGIHCCCCWLSHITKVIRMLRQDLSRSHHLIPTRSR